MSKHSLGSSQPPINAERGDFSWGYSGRSVNLTTHLIWCEVIVEWRCTSTSLRHHGVYTDNCIYSGSSVEALRKPTKFFGCSGGDMNHCFPNTSQKLLHFDHWLDSVDVLCSYLLDAEVRSIRGILENANSSRTNCVNLVCLTSTDLAAQWLTLQRVHTSHTQLLHFERLFSCLTRTWHNAVSVCLSGTFLIPGLLLVCRHYVTKWNVKLISFICNKHFLAEVMQWLELCSRLLQDKCENWSVTRRTLFCVFWLNRKDGRRSVSKCQRHTHTRARIYTSGSG
jgi:hypothetical protein